VGDKVANVHAHPADACDWSTN